MEVAVLGSPSLTVLRVSVDVKQHLKKKKAHELYESRGGRPGLPVPNSPYGLCRQKATLEEELHEDRAFYERTEPIVNTTTGARYAVIKFAMHSIHTLAYKL